MTESILFYHKDDLDGICSNQIVIKFLSETNPSMIIRSIGVSHDNFDSMKETSLYEGKDVYILDFCPPTELFNNMCLRANRIIWIDHHQDAIERMMWPATPVEGYRRSGLAACELTWNYCFPTEKMPKAVRYIGRHDVWDHSDSKTLPFQIGFNAKVTDEAASGFLWKTALMNYTETQERLINECVEFGETILSLEQKQEEKELKEFSFEVELETNFGTFKALVINKLPFGSRTKPLDEKYDLALMFFMLPSGEWKVSLRTPKDIDLSKIAKFFSPFGGGHKQAAGFTCSELPWRRRYDV